MRRTQLKGYRVTKTSRGKTVLEPIPAYGRSVSEKIRMKNSKRVRVSKRVPG